jgi:hypothetical protein
MYMTDPQSGQTGRYRPILKNCTYIFCPYFFVFIKAIFYDIIVDMEER